MTYTRLYPKLLECRSPGQISLSKEIKARNSRTKQQEKKLKERIKEYAWSKQKEVSIASKVDLFLLKAARPK